IMARIQPTIEQFRVACGFDPLQTIQRIAVGMKHLDAGPATVLVIRGISRADMMRCVDKAFSQPTKTVTQARGVITVHGDVAGEPSTHFAFADARTMVVAAGTDVTADELRATLDSGA